MIPHDADFVVRGYNGRELLLETWHRGEASLAVEVSAWRSRIARGEATRVEVEDRRHPRYSTQTIGKERTR